jgi:two-component system response regulator HydG
MAQVKLLRALQEGEIKRVGSDEVKQVDVRVIAATNVELKRQVDAGKFREDLYYRLNVVAITLPPLRERREDIPLLAYHFLGKYAVRAGKDVRKFAPEVVRVLQQQHWPGNVRELENAMEYAVVFAKEDTVNVSDLPFEAPEASGRAPVRASSGIPWPEVLVEMPYRDAKSQALAAFESAYFRAVLDRSGGNVSKAAREAGLDRSNFRRAAKRAGIDTRSR